MIKKPNSTWIDSKYFFFSSKSDLTGRRHHNLAIPVSVDVHKPPAAVATNPQPFHHDSSDNQSSSEQDISIPYPAGGDSTRIKVENLLRNQSPQPLIGVDRKYSFIDIREKCRKLIQFHLNSSNTKMWCNKKEPCTQLQFST